MNGFEMFLVAFALIWGVPVAIGSAGYLSQRLGLVDVPKVEDVDVTFSDDAEADSSPDPWVSAETMRDRLDDSTATETERTACWRCDYQRPTYESCPECGASCKPLTKRKQQQEAPSR